MQAFIRFCLTEYNSFTKFKYRTTDGLSKMVVCDAKSNDKFAMLPVNHRFQLRIIENINIPDEYPILRPWVVNELEPPVSTFVLVTVATPMVTVVLVPCAPTEIVVEMGC
jgi:hypothetical protein